MRREQAVFAGFAFDGWQIDTVGQHTAYDYSGASFSLDDFNPPFINHARATLGRRMVFDTVDAGGENQVAQNANVDFVYSELWSGNPNYLSFQQRVDNVGWETAWSCRLLNYGLTTGYFNEASVRLADAAMFAAGASHVELGDGKNLLHNEYSRVTRTCSCRLRSRPPCTATTIFSLGTRICCGVIRFRQRTAPPSRALPEAPTPRQAPSGCFPSKPLGAAFFT